MSIIEEWIPRHRVISIIYLRVNTLHAKFLDACMAWSFTTEKNICNFSLIRWNHQTCSFKSVKLYKWSRHWIRINKWHKRKNINSGNKISSKSLSTTCINWSVEEYQLYWEYLMLLKNSSTTMRIFGTGSLLWWTTRQGGLEYQLSKDFILWQVLSKRPSYCSISIILR